jgi:hypothetical protein
VKDCVVPNPYFLSLDRIRPGKPVRSRSNWKTPSLIEQAAADLQRERDAKPVTLDEVSEVEFRTSRPPESVAGMEWRPVHQML